MTIILIIIINKVNKHIHNFSLVIGQHIIMCSPRRFFIYVFGYVIGGITSWISVLRLWPADFSCDRQIWASQGGSGRRRVTLELSGELFYIWTWFFLTYFLVLNLLFLVLEFVKYYFSYPGPLNRILQGLGQMLFVFSFLN